MIASTAIPTFVALAIVATLGFSIVALVAPGVPLWWFERAGFAWVLGFGGALFIWIATTPVSSVVGVRSAVTAVALPITILAWRRGTTSARASVQLERPSLLVAAACVVLAAQMVWLLMTAMTAPLGWDGLFNFEMKARLAFEQQPAGHLPIAYFSDASRAWSHPRYPLLVPFAEFWVYSWLGRIDQVAIKILFPLYFFALIGVACGIVRRLSSSGPAVATGIALLSLPALSMGPGAVTGYADVPLAAAALAALSCTLMSIERSDRRTLWLAAALASVVVWTKAEGLVLSLCLGCAAALALRGGPFYAASKHRSAPYGALIAAPLLAALPWMVFQARFGMPDTDFPSVSLAVALQNIDRLGYTLSFAVGELLHPGRWGLIWPVFASAMLWTLVRRDFARADVLMASVVVLPFVAYIVVYLFSGWADWREHIGTSFERLLIPLAPVALIFSISRAAALLRVEPSWSHR